MEKHSYKKVHPLLSLLAILDYICYIIVFFSLFLFTSLLSTENNDIIFFNIIMIIVLSLQFIRPLIFLIMSNTRYLIQEIFLFILFFCLYILSIQIPLEYSYNHSILFILKITIKIIFYILYILLVFPRVSSFIRLIKMDFLYSFTFGFIFLIFFGTWLLSLPISRNINIPIIDLVFTATSAVTITGLSSINIFTDLSLFGQIIILILIQVGGLGILTFSTLYIINLKNRLSFEERVNTQEVFGAKTVQDVNKLLKGIFSFTIIIELIGAFIIYIGTSDIHMNFKYRIFFSVFHAVNAFCNAGFSTISSSLRFFYDNPLIIYTVSFMIILGGLGFVTLLDIYKKMTSYFSKNKIEKKIWLNPQTKVILIMSFIFVFLGSFLFYYFEQNNTLQYFSFWEKINNSFFQSVASRTAGYQTVSIEHLENPTLWTTIVFMFIGTAPNSTGGGLKLTTLFVLIWGTLKIALHRTKTEKPLLGFNFTSFLVAKAGIILFIRLIIVVTAIIILMYLENKPSITIIFEVVSAFSTTGLSMNLTPQLTTGSKIVLIILMFIGRVGSFYILSNIVPLKNKKSTTKRKKNTMALE